MPDELTPWALGGGIPCSGCWAGPACCYSRRITIANSSESRLTSPCLRGTMRMLTCRCQGCRRERPAGNPRVVEAIDVMLESCPLSPVRVHGRSRDETEWCRPASAYRSVITSSERTGLLSESHAIRACREGFLSRRNEKMKPQKASQTSSRQRRNPCSRPKQRPTGHLSGLGPSRGGLHRGPRWGIDTGDETVGGGGSNTYLNQY